MGDMRKGNAIEAITFDRRLPLSCSFGLSDPATQDSGWVKTTTALHRLSLGTSGDPASGLCWAFVPNLNSAHLPFVLNPGKLDCDHHVRLFRLRERHTRQVLSDVCDPDGAEPDKGEGADGCAR